MMKNPELKDMKPTMTIPVLSPHANGHAPAVPNPVEVRSSAGISAELSGSRVDNREMPGTPPLLKFVILGPSMSSLRDANHANNFSTLSKELAAMGHEVLFLERTLDSPAPASTARKIPARNAASYNSLSDFKERHSATIRKADAIIVASCVPEAAAIGKWVQRAATGMVAFYDLDPPATLARLADRFDEHLTADLIPKYDVYLSLTGGPLLDLLQTRFGSPMARPLHCSADTAVYYPERHGVQFDLGYLGPYSEDRQPALDELLLCPARNWEEGRFIVAGAHYPRRLRWPENVHRQSHVSSGRERAFYCSQKFVLNITRTELADTGYVPSLTMFEAAACGTPVISDYWEGVHDFFTENEEILISHSSEETLYYLLETTEADRVAIARRARQRVLSQHTAKRRAAQLVGYVCEVLRPTLTVRRT